MKNQVIITKNDLDTFKRDLIDVFQQLSETSQANTGITKRWLRTNEVAEYLSLSPTQIHNLKAEGKLHCRKLGGTNYYDKKQIDNLLKGEGVRYE